MAEHAALIQLIIPVAALIISLLTYILNARALRQKASNDHVASVEQQLRHELESCQEAIAQCHAERDALQRENIALMREMTRRPGLGGV